MAASAGAPFEKGRPEDGLLQALTLFFRVGGIDRARLPKEEGLVEETKIALEEGEIDIFIPGPGWEGIVSLGTKGSTVRDTEMSVNMGTAIGLDATKADDLTRAENESRKRVMGYISFYRKYVSGLENCFLINTGAQVGVRETRRIMGEVLLTEEDVVFARKSDDCIAKASYYMDLHDYPPLPRKYKEDHVPVGDWYEIPYGCLVPKEIDNLLVAGRCVSSDRPANGSLRIQVTCMATGQAAGTAAALSLAQDAMPRKLDVKLLQKALFEQGADLRPEVVT